MARITIRISDTFRNALSQHARRVGTTESDLIREALERYLQSSAESESCFEIAKRGKLIGIAKKLPKDLSTNRKHFEGFGR